MALRVCCAFGPWFWLGCGVSVCACVFVWFFVCCGSLFLAPCSCLLCVCAWGLQKSKAAPLPEVLGIWANLVGGGVLSKRFESALGSKIQDPRCPENFARHLGSWILDLGALSNRFESTAPLLGVLVIWANLVGCVCFQSALKAHPPNQICSNTKGFWVLKLGSPQHLENLL